VILQALATTLDGCAAMFSLTSFSLKIWMMLPWKILLE